MSDKRPGEVPTIKLQPPVKFVPAPPKTVPVPKR